MRRNTNENGQRWSWNIPGTEHKGDWFPSVEEAERDAGEKAFRFTGGLSTIINIKEQVVAKDGNIIFDEDCRGIDAVSGRYIEAMPIGQQAPMSLAAQHYRAQQNGAQGE